MKFDGTNKYLRITDIDDETNTFRQNDITSPNKDLSTSENYILEPGDIVFARTGASVGKTYLYKKEDGRVFFAGFLIRARTKANVDEGFVFQNTMLSKYRAFVKLTSQRSGQPGINAQEYSSYSLKCPSSEEQINIGQYFQKLDSLIWLHKRKHDKLVILKKAMLQKMFPRPGATTPEIRFKGFSREWVEKEFRLIASRSSQSCSEKNLPRIEYEDIVSGNGRLNKNLFRKISQKTGIKFSKGDVLFGKLRPYLRNWWLAEFDGIAVGDFWVLTSTAATPSFLYFLIQTEAFETIANQSAGSKMPRSDWKLVSNSLFRAPADPLEQQKIGTHFRQLDELISMHAIQLQKLKQIKSACLEKMFV